MATYRITVKRENTDNPGFDPRDLPAVVGDCAFWYNEDSNTTHQVYPKGGTVGSWGAPIGPQSSSMQVNLDTAGTYDYQCAVEGHENETGTLVVT